MFLPKFSNSNTLSPSPLLCHTHSLVIIVRLIHRFSHSHPHPNLSLNVDRGFSDSWPIYRATHFSIPFYFLASQYFFPSANSESWEISCSIAQHYVSTILRSGVRIPFSGETKKDQCQRQRMSMLEKLAPCCFFPQFFHLRQVLFLKWIFKSSVGKLYVRVKWCERGER